MNQTRHSHKHAWIAGIIILITAISSLAAVRHVSSNEQDGIYFHTLSSGARLPSGAECARRIRASPSHESRSMNTLPNRTIGYHVEPSFFPPGDSPQVAKLAQQISGDFTGTTQQVLQWAACKWGIDQNVVFAQAAVESWWRQDELGDWTANAELCPPDHRIGADGKPGECPQSYGILQNRYSLEKSAWPGIGVSTAMNADAAYAIWRSCYDGYEVWLNKVSDGRPYHAGDLWGCIGRWFAGDWYTPDALKYIDLVKKSFSEQVWLQPNFARAS
jgi:autotransporter family porin